MPAEPEGAGRARAGPGKTARALAPGLGYCVGWVLLARLAWGLGLDEVLAPWFPPSALTLAFVLLAGRRALPFLAVPPVLAALWFGPQEGGVGLLTAVAVVISAVYGTAGLLLRHLGLDLRRASMRDVGLFALVGVAAAPTAAAAAALGVLGGAGALTPGPFWSSLATWALGDAIGIATLAPGLLVFAGPGVTRLLGGGAATPLPAPPRRRRRVVVVEGVMQGASLLATLWIVFGLLPPTAHVEYICFGPLMWIALRHGFPGAAAGVAATSTGVVAAMATASGWGQSVHDLQLLTVGLSLVALTLGAAVTGWRRARAVLAETARGLVDAQRVARLGSCDIDLRSGSWQASSEFYLLYGRPRAWFGETARSLLQGILALVPPEERAGVAEAVRGAVQAGADVHVRFRMVRPDGTERVLSAQGELMRDDSGRPVRLVGTVRDVTDAFRAQERLRFSERRFRSLVQHASDVIAILSADGRLTYASPAVDRVLGCHPADLLGRSFDSLVHPGDVPGVLAAVPEDGDSSLPRLLRLRHSTGRWRDVEVVASNLIADPAVAGVVLNIRDVTEQRSYEARLSRQAFWDDLTGLPNRTAFTQALGAAILPGAGERGPALLFVDVDDFKVVNDSLGHAEGDRLLLHVARRLTGCLSVGDTVARLGSDTFAVLLTEGGSADDLLTVARRVRDELSAPFELRGRDVFVTAGVGVAAARDADSPEDLLRNADVALHRAKELGSGHIALFDAEMRRRVVRRLELDTDIRKGLERNEFRLAYQPIVNLPTGDIVGVEALIRWRRPGYGEVPPMEFIPFAEETGLVLPIGRWALEEACRQLRVWQHELPGRAITMSVNVSARQFHQPDMVGEVAAVLSRTGVEPELLCLELTEHALLHDGDSVLETLHALRDLGVELVIDDFGTGYSSFFYLKRIPATTVKVDRVFVAGITARASDLAVVRAVTTVGRSLGLTVTAEGVETAEQTEILRSLGCDRVQGYYFGPPSGPTTIGQLLSRGRVGGLVPGAGDGSGTGELAEHPLPVDGVLDLG